MYWALVASHSSAAIALWSNAKYGDGMSCTGEYKAAGKNAKVKRENLTFHILLSPCSSLFRTLK